MGSKKKRVGRPVVAPPMKSLRKARLLTTTFHRATQAVAGSNLSDNGVAASVDANGVAKDEATAQLGGLAQHHRAYQDASILTTSVHRTSKWVIHRLLEDRLRPGKGQPKLPLLEIGAVNTQLSRCTWLDTTAIDLNSTHPLIQQLDFFKLDPTRRFAVVVCAMVLNCLPSPISRGKMLRKIHTHLRKDGLLFMMLPLLCMKSRYMNRETFMQAMAYAGFELKVAKDTPKIAFWCFRRVVVDPSLLAPPKLRPDISENSEHPQSGSKFFCVEFAGGTRQSDLVPQAPGAKSNKAHGKVKAKRRSKLQQ